MIIPVILVIIQVGGFGYAFTTTVEFSTMENCDHARTVIKDAMPSSARIFCVLK
jgi:hypothetical protein